MQFKIHPEQAGIKFKLFLIVLSTLYSLLSTSVYAATYKVYGAVDTTGGSVGSLDSINHIPLVTGDVTIVSTSTETCYYRYDSTSSATESGSGCSADNVRPDSNTGAGRWIKQAAGFNLEDLKDVASMTESEGQILYYDATTSSWKNTSILYIDDVNNRVGIGTTTPLAPLDVNGGAVFQRQEDNNSIYTAGSVYRNRSSATAPSAGFGVNFTFDLEGFTNNSYVNATSIDSIWENNQTNDTTDRDAALIFETAQDNSRTEKMRITSAGNVGVGTTSPDNRFHIELDDASNSSVTYPYRLTHTTSGTPAAGIGAGMEFEVETSVGNNEVGAVIEAVATDVTATSEDFDLVFKTMTAGAGASETMRIKSTGNIVVTGNIERVPTSNFLPTRIASLTLNAGENGGMAIAISGRYAYVVTNSSPGKLVVIDISVPTAPTRMAALTLNTGENAVRGLHISGKYAYISTGASPSQVVIVDISNPVSPIRMGGLTLNSGENDARGIAIVGRYAYIVTYTAPARVISLDISNPTLPLRLNSVTMNSGESNGAAIAVSGDYAFITTDTGTVGKVISIDISNPYALARLDDVSGIWGVERDHRQIVISGRYAYIPSDISPASVSVIDISNPSNLVRTGGIVLNSDENYNSAIAIAGRYVYTLGSTTGVISKIQVIDVTNPAAPVRLGGTTLASGETTGRSMAISGRYIYVATYDSPFKFVVLDMGGAEISSMMAHSLEADSLMVRGNITVYDHLKVKGGLNVGEPAYLPEVATGKIQVNTKLSVPLTTSTPTLSSCGTTPAIIGNNVAGTIIVGTGTVNACTITFANAFLANAPSCVVSGTSTSLLYISSESTTAITIGCTSCEGTTINYHCIGVE